MAIVHYVDTVRNFGAEGKLYQVATVMMMQDERARVKSGLLDIIERQHSNFFRENPLPADSRGFVSRSDAENRAQGFEALNDAAFRQKLMYGEIKGPESHYKVSGADLREGQVLEVLPKGSEKLDEDGLRMHLAKHTMQPAMHVVDGRMRWL